MGNSGAFMNKLLNIAVLCAVASATAGCHHKSEEGGLNSTSFDGATTSDIQRLEARATACAGGRTVTLSAGVKVDIIEAIRGNVDFNASAQDALVGAIFEGQSLSDPNVLEGYRIYESCLRTVQF